MNFRELSLNYGARSFLFIIIFLLSFVLSNFIVGIKTREIIMILGVIIFVFLLPKLSISVYALLIFFPILPFLRKLSFIGGGWTRFDPLLVLPHVVIIFMFLNLVFFKESTMLKFVKTNRVVKYVTVLGFIFLLEIINPVQGSVIVGLSGAMFIIIPMLWFYFSLGLSDKEFKTALKVIILIGLFTGAYGIYQHYAGVFGFEREWMSSTELDFYLKEKTPRAFSTFAGSGDFGFYMLYAGAIAFWHLYYTKNLYYLVVLIITQLGNYFSGTRTSMISFLAFVAMFFLINVRDKKQLIIRGVAFLFTIMIIYNYMPEDLKNMVSIHPSQRTFATHTVTGLVNPLGEESVKTRFGAWTTNIKSVFTEYPFGAGIGSATLAAMRFKGEYIYTDSSYFSILVGSGIIGGILLLLIYLFGMIYIFTLFIESKHNEEYRGIFAFYTVLIITSVFGINLTFYTISFFFWMTLGWICKEYTFKLNRINEG